jgi:hypothetical protein
VTRHDKPRIPHRTAGAQVAPLDDGDLTTAGSEGPSGA